MLQAVATLVSLLVGTIAIASIVHLLGEEGAAIRSALGLAPKQAPLAPLPPRYRVIAARRGATLRLTPPARVRAAL